MRKNKPAKLSRAYRGKKNRSDDDDMIFLINDVPVSLAEVEKVYPGVSRMYFTEGYALVYKYAGLEGQYDGRSTPDYTEVDTQNPFYKEYRASTEEMVRLQKKYFKLESSEPAKADDLFNKVQECRTRSTEIYRKMQMISKLSKNSE